VQKAEIARRACSASSARLSLGKAALKGPLQKDGHFFTSYKGLALVRSLNQIAPSAKAWTKTSDSRHGSRGGNWEPVFIPLMVLSRSVVRTLSKNPGKGFRKKIPQGTHEVWPRRECIALHNKRAAAYQLLAEVADMAWSCSPSKGLDKIFSEAILLNHRLFRGWGDGCAEFRSVQAKLSYHRRWFRKLAHGHGKRPYQGPLTV
jgi:hypothetical protein